MHRVLFQGASVLLMAFQSFVSPVLIGLESYGEQILLMSGVLLAQASFEPICQSICNGGFVSDRSEINASSLTLATLLSLFIFSAAAMVLGVGYGDALVVFILLLVYLFNTLLVSFAFSRNMIDVAAYSISGLVFFYVVGFCLAMFFAPGWELVFGLIVGLLASIIIIILWVWRSVSFRFSFGPVSAAVILNGFSFRLPAIFFTTGTLLLMSAIGFSAATVGQYKIFVSAITAGRYFNAVPLPEVQALVHRVLTRVRMH